MAIRRIWVITNNYAEFRNRNQILDKKNQFSLADYAVGF